MTTATTTSRRRFAYPIRIGISSIAANEATKKPNSQNTRPNTGADSSAVAKRGQSALIAGSSRSSAESAPARRSRNCSTAMNSMSSYAGTPMTTGTAARRTAVEGEGDDADEKEKQQRDQSEFFTPIAFD